MFKSVVFNVLVPHKPMVMLPDYTSCLLHFLSALTASSLPSSSTTTALPPPSNLTVIVVVVAFAVLVVVAVCVACLVYRRYVYSLCHAYELCKT